MKTSAPGGFKDGVGDRRGGYVLAAKGFETKERKSETRKLTIA